MEQEQVSMEQGSIRKRLYLFIGPETRSESRDLSVSHLAVLALSGLLVVCPDV
jgi:hypothetical protein